MAFGEGISAVQIDMFHDVHASGSTVYLRLPEKLIIQVQLMIMDLERCAALPSCETSGDLDCLTSNIFTAALRPASQVSSVIHSRFKASAQIHKP